MADDITNERVDIAVIAPYPRVMPGEPPSRVEVEKALRNLNANEVESRDALLYLAAQVVLLTEELARRLDAPDLEATIAEQLPARLEAIRLQDATGRQHVELAANDDKYEVVPATPPCAELIPICHARCCRFRFALSSTDLDEGIVRWDYARPYRIRQRVSDGYCTHNDAETHFCTVHEVRPSICRTYHCQDDKRIWIDFERRIPAPLEALNAEPDQVTIDLVERLRARRLANEIERDRIDRTPTE